MWWVLLAWTASAGEPAWDALGDLTQWIPVTRRATSAGTVHVAYQQIEGQDCVQGWMRTELELYWLDAVVNDTSEDADRDDGLAVSEVLDVGHNRMEFYQVMEVPDWTMVADRWWLLRAWTELGETEGRRFRWMRLDASEHYPEVVSEVASRFPGAIELPVNWGEWFFEEQGTSRVAYYRVCTEMGGALPRWMQRMGIRKTLPDNIVKLVEEAERRAGVGNDAPR